MTTIAHAHDIIQLQANLIIRDTPSTFNSLIAGTVTKILANGFDSVLIKLNSSIKWYDGLVSETIIKGSTFDAFVASLEDKTDTIFDGLLVNNIMKTQSFNGLILEEVLKGSTFNAIILEVVTKTDTTFDGLIREIAFSGNTFDGLIIGEATKTVTFDSILSNKPKSIERNFIIIPYQLRTKIIIETS